jgi:D-alanine-D-alanine ligase
MKRNIAIITGGNSSEAEISLLSAETVINNMDDDAYHVYKVVIKGNDWSLIRDGHNGIPIDKNDFSCIINDQKVQFDCAFIVIHGTPGEDGKLQGYLDMLGIPYTTSGQLTTALTFDKNACKIYLADHGVRMPASILLKKGQEYSQKDIINNVGIPCFVKPNSGGSSFGISKVQQVNEMDKAIGLAFEEGNEVLIEKFIDGRELTCGVVRQKGILKALAVTEIISKKEFFDYEAKYIKGMADEITPADISEQIESECKDISNNLYDFLDCKGIVRFDYILSNGQLFLLEVNAVPGLTDNSLVPKQAEYAGITLRDLFSMTLDEALSND